MQVQWDKPAERFCGNCGLHLYGIAGSNGLTKFQCHRCGMVMVTKKKSRRMVQVEEYAPRGEQFI